VTRVPLTLRVADSESPSKSFFSMVVIPVGIEVLFGSEENSKSMLTPRNSILIIGTKASSTGTNSLMSFSSDSSLKVGGKSAKKSSMETNLGATTSVSISEDGPWTPRA